MTVKAKTKNIGISAKKNKTFSQFVERKKSS